MNFFKKLFELFNDWCVFSLKDEKSSIQFETPITTTTTSVYCTSTSSIKPTISPRNIYLTEQDLLDVGFTKYLMLGTGYLTTSSMRDAKYYYKSPNQKITINCTEFWTWFLNDEQKNSIAVSTKKDLKILLNQLDN